MMHVNRKQNSLSGAGGQILREAVKYGPVVTFLVTAVLSGGLGYFVYQYLLSGWVDSNREYRQAVVRKEVENRKTEKMLQDEDHFRAEFGKIVSLYDEAKPLLPQETEVSDVLGQVEAAARRNGVTLTGLMAVKESVKSAQAEKLYEREVPAMVTGPYPQVVKFFTDVSRMPRILLVRDFSVVSLRNSVSAGFTLVAYHAPPPAEMPKTPVNMAQNVGSEVTK